MLLTKKKRSKTASAINRLLKLLLKLRLYQLEISLHNIMVVQFKQHNYSLFDCLCCHAPLFLLFSLSLRPAGSLHSLISLFHWLIPLISLVLKGQRISMSEDQNKEPAETATARVSVKKLLQLIVISIWLFVQPCATIFCFYAQPQTQIH